MNKDLRLSQTNKTWGNSLLTDPVSTKSVELFQARGTDKSETHISRKK